MRSAGKAKKFTTELTGRAHEALVGLALDWGDLGLSGTIELLIREYCGLPPFQRPYPETRAVMVDVAADLGLAEKRPTDPVPPAESVREETESPVEDDYAGLSEGEPADRMPPAESPEALAAARLTLPATPPAEATPPSRPGPEAPRGAFVRSWMDANAPSWARAIGDSLAAGLDDLVSDDQKDHLRRWQQGEEL